MYLHEESQQIADPEQGKTLGKSLVSSCGEGNIFIFPKM
jgi:hypothetical protein